MWPAACNVCDMCIICVHTDMTALTHSQCSNNGNNVLLYFMIEYMEKLFLFSSADNFLKRFPEQISMKPGRRTHLGPEMTPLPFGADLNADEVDLNMFSLILDLIV